MERIKALSILKKYGIPGPEPYFFKLNFNATEERNQFKLAEWRRKYGDIFGYYFADAPFIISFNKELNQLIEVKDFQYFTNRQPAFGDHEFTDKFFGSYKDEKWKTTRTLFRVVFTTGKLKTMTPTMDHTLDDIMKKIDAIGTNEFDIHPLFKEAVIRIIAGWGFGIDPDGELFDRLEVILQRELERQRGLLSGLLVVFSRFPIICYIITKIGRCFTKQVFEEVFEIAEMVVERKRKSSVQQEDLVDHLFKSSVTVKELDNIKVGDLKMDDSADKSVQQNQVNDKNVKRMTNDEVVAAVGILIAGGNDPVTSCLTFTLSLIVNHPECQDKLRQEIQEYVEKRGSLDYGIVSSLQYLDAVVNESLRLYPPGTLGVVREAKIDYKFQDIIIPKGSTVCVPAYFIHRDPENWERPDEFEPERFLGDNKKKIDASIFQPFGEGPRNCIGMRLALYEVKYILAKLLINYRFEPGAKTEKKITVDDQVFLIAPKNGLHVRAVKLQ